VQSRPRRSLATRGLALALLALSPWIAPARAQGLGDYMNVESPQVSPITVATVGTRRVLLVCNTPDNSLEVWDTDESIMPAGARLNDRLRVGLEPVSVHALGDRFWTANFLGDSVTTGRLEIVGTQVKARLLATAEVGDEPMDIVFFDHGGTGTVCVTLNTSSALAWLDGDTLAPHDPLFPVHRLVQSSGLQPHGLKEPHAVRVQGGRVFALAFKGGVTHANSNHDLDVLSAALPGTPGAPLVFDRQVVLPSTTNSNMRFATDGSLWVVGGEALNMTVETKPQARAEPSGFVQSTLYRITGAGTGSPSIQRRDINRVCGTPVDGTPDLPLAMPTDIALFEVGGVVTKVFVAAFSSDRIGVFSKPMVCSEWSRRTMGYGTGPVGGGPRWGPRGLALGTNQAGLVRLYVMNRLDNSISIFDPVSETVIESVAMHDPTPAYIRQGREFLYSADQSGNGFVSCASCHTDGRTDGLSWKLGNPAGTGPVEVPPLLVDVFRLMGTGIRNSDPDFNMAMLFPPDGTPPATEPPRFDPIDPNDKREMVTQSLQGLSNFEVAFTDPVGARGTGEQSGLVRTLFHNAPFHWRGDKKSLRDFNEAFVTLLGGPDVDGIDPPDGLTALEMDRFETFVHSITYPPNPKQPKDRTFSAGATGGQNGLRRFHEAHLPIVAERSCVHCHTLPEGSNNRLTIFVNSGLLDGYVGQSNRQPTESSAMRGLFQKEPLLEVDGNFPVDPSQAPIVGHFGLNHNGTIDRNGTVLTSLNTFINAFFPSPTDPDALAIKQFAHEFDWGVAPAIGQVVFAPQTSGSIPALLARVHAMEDQAKAANASLVAWGEFPGQVPERRGWRYYPVNGTYVEEPGFASFTLSQIQALLTMPAHSVTFLSVPLGSERRVAAPSGTAGNYPQRTPANVVLEPMVTNTAYAVVPTLRVNWVPPNAPSAVKVGLTPTELFNFVQPGTGPAGGEPKMDEVFAKTMRLFQYGLRDGQNTMNYGVSNLRHEAPRRLRVRGDDIVTGAKLLLSVPWPVLPYSGLPPSDPSARATFPTLTLELPIYPTDDVLGGQTVWETAVELDPFWAYALMLGGPRAPHTGNNGLSAVQNTIDFAICSELPVNPCGSPGLPSALPVLEPTDAVPFASPYDPDHWNWYKVQIRNPGAGGPDTPGPVSAAVWQQLRM
jgi:hypothetical protein